MTVRRLALLSCAAMLWACPAKDPAPRAPVTDPTEALRPVEHVLVDDGEVASLRSAIERSQIWLRTRDPGTQFTFGPRTLDRSQVEQSLATFLSLLEDNPDGATLSSRVAGHFDLLESVGNVEGEVLVTGYFEPSIKASRRRTKQFTVPIYSPPPDIVRVNLGAFSDKYDGESLVGRLSGARLVPYWNRRDIHASKKLAGRRLEIAWAMSPVDMFFLEVQGSGTLVYPDGTEQRIGYAGSNGRPYRSIGRLLIDQGEIPEEEISMQSIRAYLDANPGEVSRVLEHNESHVFFKFLDGPPRGNLGQPVTPGRSIATDQRMFPPGALAFLETTTPATEGAPPTPVRRFVLNQDTGGAIRGPGRVDFFWGRGEHAAKMAGHMKEPGRLFFLVPKPVATAGVSP